MTARNLTRRSALALAAAGASSLALGSGSRAQAREKVRFGTNWLAQAEHGGFYQAVVDGTYARYGLDVEIVMGGPQTNGRLMLLTGRLDYYMGANMIQSLLAVKENVPTVVIASIFQKEPQCLIAHPGQGYERFLDLKACNNLMLSKQGQESFFQWMKAEFGFRDEQVRPYTFNAAPFLANKKSAMQGYITSEPYAIEKEAGFKPKVFLLADEGFDTYSTTIETRADVVAGKADITQRFVDASVIGWYNYIYGDNAAANAAIKAANPDMTDDKIAAGIRLMKEHGIVDSGDSLKVGIGAMTDARMKSFFDKMVKAGVAPAGLDYARSYTLAFTNKGVGLNLRPRG
ncbi:MAG: ABC transporter substrate-binding protein [Bosea sp.]|jgi:NitT/TauT family transport system substrate-binding protein|nr:ABC transporter substrate-binding protein [Bosea sp. (in: a-proteobacteria)]